MATISSICADDFFEVEVAPEFYKEGERSNINPELLDEFCDMVEESFPDESDCWDEGYVYHLYREDAI